MSRRQDTAYHLFCEDGMEKTYGLEKIHDGLFEIMVALDELCEKHNIQYFLDSGTLLGAVRHKDFIPWDDDVDLTMTRDNFERFCEVAHELQAPFKFVMPNEYGGYFFDFVARIINTEFPLREETDADRAYNSYQNRLAVDIFIIDNAPDSDAKFKWMVLRQKMLYGYAMAHRFEKTKQKHGFVESAQIFVLGTLGKLQTLSKIFKKQQKLSAKYREVKTERYCLSNTIMKEIHLSYPKRCIEGAVKLPIRDRMFSAPSGYEEILTNMYGDYMTPPKEEDRRPMHI